jgi:hypothetical protein
MSSLERIKTYDIKLWLSNVYIMPTYACVKYMRINEDDDSHYLSSIQYKGISLTTIQKCSFSDLFL